MGIQLRWLGQAGFSIRMENGRILAVDPYLSDSCRRLVGFKRMVPAPVAPEQFGADYLFISHEHEDHLDTDLFALLQHRSDMQIFVNGRSLPVLEKYGLSAERVSTLAAGDCLELDGVTVRALRADHGDMAPDALGFLFDFGRLTVYFAGDTALTPELLAPAIEARPDVALLPINGMYGNLDCREAAKLADLLGCRLVIPCHCGMFVEHGGDLLGFRTAMEQYPEIGVFFPALGEQIEL